MPKTADVVNKQRGAAADTVLEQIHGLMHLYRAKQYHALRGSPDAVTHLESKVLAFFARRPGATQTDLVSHSQRDKGQLARLIAGLRARGLLEARADASDRRTVRLHLTDDGSAAELAVRRQARRLAAVALKGFTAEERQQLSALLERARANLSGCDEGGPDRGSA